MSERIGVVSELQTLCLRRNEVGVDGMSSQLQHLKQLTKLELSSMKDLDGLGSAFPRHLGCLVYLKSLDLSDLSMVGDEGFAAATAAIGH